MRDSGAPYQMTWYVDRLLVRVVGSAGLQLVQGCSDDAGSDWVCQHNEGEGELGCLVWQETQPTDKNLIAGVIGSTLGSAHHT
jgi:hypothetical protein